MTRSKSDWFPERVTLILGTKSGVLLLLKKRTTNGGKLYFWKPLLKYLINQVHRRNCGVCRVRLDTLVSQKLPRELYLNAPLKFWRVSYKITNLRSHIIVLELQSSFIVSTIFVPTLWTNWWFMNDSSRFKFINFWISECYVRGVYIYMHVIFLMTNILSILAQR